MPLIVHISDLHISELGFDEDVFIKAVAEINAINPDMIILTGDLTNNGYYSEFIQATKYLEMMMHHYLQYLETMMHVIWVMKLLKS